MTMDTKEPPQDYEPLTPDQIFNRSMIIPVMRPRPSEKEIELLTSDLPASHLPQELVDKIKPTLEEWDQELL
jgi:hypothetical protein